MSAEDQPAVPDAPDDTEPKADSEQTQTESEAQSYGDQLLALAREDGYPIGDEPPKAQAPEEPEAEEPEPELELEPKPEEEPEEEEAEEEKPAAAKDAGDKLVPLREVLEERSKRKRANDRADRAETLVAQYQAELQKAVMPSPTEADPFIDIGDINHLDRLERSYEKTIDLADENPDGAVDVLVGKNSDGSEKRVDFTAEQLTLMKRKAEKAIRKQIPDRRKYLEARAVYDQQAVAAYPQLQDPDSEFTQTAAVLAQKVLRGEAANEPELLIWIGHAVKGYLESRGANGANASAVQTPGSKKILQAAKQKVAPTPTRARSFPERARGSDLVKAEKKLEERGDADSAEEVVAAIFSNRGSTKRLQ